jgi:hypothetical protein
MWSATSATWLNCPSDELIWLDRSLLSGGRDRSLHRPPRCPGLRHVHHRWELFSRDPTHAVFMAPFISGTAPDHRAVQAAARHVLPIAQGAFEAQPVRPDAGSWIVSVGKWVLPVCIGGTPEYRDNPTVPPGHDLPITYEIDRAADALAPQARPVPDAVPQVARYFQRNPTACQAMAYYYQDFLRGGLAPQVPQMTSVEIALDLNRGAVSEYKKELQRHIWSEQGHQRELGQFLLLNGLIDQADLQQALQAVAQNEAAGRIGLARERLRYSKKKPQS